MRISVFGLGYVGAVTSACLARAGHQIVGVDVDERKVDAINAGSAPMSEPGLAELLTEGVDRQQLTATTDVKAAVRGTDAAIVCVGTPSLPSGGLEDTYLKRVVKQIATELKAVDHPFVIVVRSTCMPTTHHKLLKLAVSESGRALGETIGYACHPEFLREGTAIDDFFDPPKTVFGTSGDVLSLEVCRQLYRDLDVDAPVFELAIDVAAMVKYTDNCFHAAKVTFANEIGVLCREQGINAVDVMKVFCQDTKLNISPRYLRPGNPFGGSCLPKDLRAMLDVARQFAVQTPMLRGIADSNREQIEALVTRILDRANGPIGIVGLAFKEHTDDLRESPSLAIVERLYGKGREVRIFDEYLSVGEIYGSNRQFALQEIPHLESLFCDDLQSLVDQSQLLLVFHRLGPDRLAPLVFRAEQHVIDFTDSFDKQGVSMEGVYW